jgi:hypothetical protein
MSKPRNFSCPKCYHKISYLELFAFRKDELTCRNCQSKLSPVKSKKFNVGFGLGFIVFIITAETIKFYGYGFSYSLLGGLVLGCLFVIVFSYYIYKETYFKTE